MKKNRILFFSVTSFFIVALALTIFGLAIYRFSKKGPLIQTIASVVPYPAAIVNGNVITYSKVFRIYQAYRTLVGDGFPAAAATMPTIINKLVDDALIQEYVHENQIQVSKDEFQQYASSLYEDLGIRQDLIDKRLKETLGMTRRDFEEAVILPDLFRKKIGHEFVSKLLEQKHRNSRIYLLIKN